MNILYLSFYFEPDLCAGSFRNSPLVKELSFLLGPEGNIHVVTTMPNRYKTYSEKAPEFEKKGNIEINRIKLSQHKSGFFDQTLAFRKYFFEALRLTKERKYDLVFASSSRLFTAFLGRILSKKKCVPLYLDIRDIFVDTMEDVIKNKFIKVPLITSLKMIERYTFSGADHINLISGGFESYFKKYRKANYSFFTNGIDENFLSISPSNNYPTDQYIITYAGNIGEGQGLHKVIPQAAKILGSKFFFRIIGDGGMKKALVDQIKELNVTNVELLNPMSRERLAQFYYDTHFLFLHLNDYKAFEKVLPSKIFEYGAMDKPMIAGVGGYSADFIKQNLTNYIIFSPGDVNSLVRQLSSFTFKYEPRSDFSKSFDRREINRLMAKSILNC